VTFGVLAAVSMVTGLPDEPDRRESTLPTTVVLAEGTVERFRGDARTFHGTRLVVDAPVSDGLRLNVSASSVDRLGQSGTGAGVGADVRLSPSWRLQPTFSVGDPSVLARTTASVTAFHAPGLSWPGGLVLTAGLSHTSMAEGRSAAVTGGVIGYAGPWWATFTGRRSHDLTAAERFGVRVPDTGSWSASLGRRLHAPWRQDASLTCTRGEEAYLAVYIRRESPPLVRLDGLGAAASWRVWLQERFSVQLTGRVTEKTWAGDGRSAFQIRSVTFGLLAEL
jgi:YaiO family outer membrane protein